jgi:hypothetical protein
MNVSKYYYYLLKTSVMSTDDSQNSQECDCPICLEKINQSHGQGGEREREREAVCTFPCKHVFHTKCIMEHLQHGVNRGAEVGVGVVINPFISCPICRAVILTIPERSSVNIQSGQGIGQGQGQSQAPFEIQQFNRGNTGNTPNFEEARQLHRQIQFEKIMLMFGMTLFVMYVMWSSVTSNK